MSCIDLTVNGDVMKLSTNHAHEKTAWLDTVQFPGQSPKVRQSSEKSSVTSPSPWVERHPTSLSERTYSKSSPPRTESFGSPPNSATPKGSLSTSGVHSQVKVIFTGRSIQCVCRLKDVRANCFCASLLTQIHMPCHVSSALSTKMNNDRADGHCYSFAWI